jgi:hypothetical protein
MQLLVRAHGVEGKSSFLPGFVTRNTLTGFYGFLQLLKENLWEEREVYFRVETRQLVSPSIPVHYPLVTLTDSTVRSEWPTVYLQTVLCDPSDRQCTYRRYCAIRVTDSVLTDGTVRSEWPTVYLQTVLCDQSDRQCTYRRYCAIRVTDSVLTDGTD